MAQSLSKFLLNAALVLALALAVSSCGRRGALEAPPSANVVSVDENDEELPEEEKVDEPFFLDKLL